MMWTVLMCTKYFCASCILCKLYDYDRGKAVLQGYPRCLDSYDLSECPPISLTVLTYLLLKISVKTLQDHLKEYLISCQ